MTALWVSVETPERFEERREAVVELMKMADAPDLRGINGGGRRYSYRRGGATFRREAIKAALAQAYVGHLLRTNDGIVSVRRA